MKEAHGKVLPIQYDEDFFKKVCWSKGSYFAICAEPVSPPTRLVGFLSAKRMPPKCFCFNDRLALKQAGVALYSNDSIMYLLTVGVMPDSRREGVAGLMLRFAIEVRAPRDDPVPHRSSIPCYHDHR